MGGIFKFTLGMVKAVNMRLLLCSIPVNSLQRHHHLLSPSSHFVVINSTGLKQLNTSSKMPAEMGTVLRFVKLTTNAFPPSKGSEKAAGFDLKR